MSKKIIIIAGALIAVLGGGGGAVYFLKPDLLPEAIRPKSAEGETHSKSESSKTESKEASKKHEPEVGADLDVFVVNLAGSGTQRYLRTVLSLGVKDEHEKEKIKELSAPIRHAIIMYLTERAPEELAEPTGKNKLREELQEKINDAIGHKMVSNVYFKEFLVQ